MPDSKLTSESKQNTCFQLVSDDFFPAMLQNTDRNNTKKHVQFAISVLKSRFMFKLYNAELDLIQSDDKKYV